MTPLRVLLVEDSDDDAMLVEGLLRRDGFEISVTRVEDRGALDEALTLDWDLVISDFSLPQFTAIDVIRAVRERGLDVPLLIVSGTIGEEAAVETMRIGADDYLMKGKLQRLPMAIRRELREFEIRRERRATVEKLHESERLMVQALALAGMGHFVWYPDPDVVVWSEDIYRIHGVKRETFTPGLESWLALVHEDDRDRARTDVVESIASGRFETSVRIVTPEGELRIIETLGECEKSASGEPVTLLGVVKDVTESRRAELERHRLQRDLELLLASTVQAMVATDGEGRCTMVNGAAELLTGFSAAELLGRRFVDVLPQKRRDGSPKEDAESPIHHVLGTATPIQKSDVPFQVRDGSTRWIDISVSPILDEGELKGAVALITDATERRLLQSELERARRLASLGQMAASIAHEFNNVLMGIQPFAELIARKTVDESVRSANERILKSVQRGRTVTQEVLRFTRPVDPTRQAVPLRALFDDLSQELKGLIPSAIHLEIRTAGAVTLDADPQQIMQVFLNLAINARDAMPEGGVLRISAAPSLSGENYSFGVVPSADRFAHAVVEDTGSGISEEVLKHVFDPFYTTKKNGTGLGLPIAYKIVEVHGGHIFVESEPGRGTAFHIFLPLAGSVAADAEDGRHPSSVTGNAGPANTARK
jgi:hypothetical protein